jgi:hypothetical protein
VFEGRAGAFCVVVGVEVLFTPPMFVTGLSAVDDDRNVEEVVAFPDLILPDGEGRILVAIILPRKFEGSVTSGR